MECTMETSLDVLSRAATMLQNEEREAALKRSADFHDCRSSIIYPHNHSDNHEENRISTPPVYKRRRGSSRSDHSSGEEDNNAPCSEDEQSSDSRKKCIATQTAFSSFTVSPASADRSVSPVVITPHMSPPSPVRERYEQPSPSPRSSPSPAGSGARYTHPPPPPYVESSHIPWQSLMAAMPHSSSLPPYPVVPLPSRHHIPATHHSLLNNQHDNTDISNIPLNLTVSSSQIHKSSEHHHQHSSVIVNSESARNSNSPGVPERLLHGRPMTTAAGNLFYPSTVSAANLAGLEARTTRKEQETDICDPSIEEHFRRSLGTAYTEVMTRSSNSSPPHSQPNSSLSRSHSRSSADGATESKVKLVSVSGTVDDHFAKALGNQTWNKIKVENEAKSQDDGLVDDHFAKALGATWHQLKTQRRTTQHT